MSTLPPLEAHVVGLAGEFSEFFRTMIFECGDAGFRQLIDDGRRGAAPVPATYSAALSDCPFIEVPSDSWELWCRLVIPALAGMETIREGAWAEVLEAQRSSDPLAHAPEFITLVWRRHWLIGAQFAARVWMTLLDGARPTPGALAQHAINQLERVTADLRSAQQASETATDWAGACFAAAPTAQFGKLALHGQPGGDEQAYRRLASELLADIRSAVADVAASALRGDRQPFRLAAQACKQDPRMRRHLVRARVSLPERWEVMEAPVGQERLQVAAMQIALGQDYVDADDVVAQQIFISGLLDEEPLLAWLRIAAVADGVTVPADPMPGASLPRSWNGAAKYRKRVPIASVELLTDGQLRFRADLSRDSDFAVGDEVRLLRALPATGGPAVAAGSVGCVQEILFGLGGYITVRFHVGRRHVTRLVREVEVESAT